MGCAEVFANLRAPPAIGHVGYIKISATHTGRYLPGPKNREGGTLVVLL